LATSSTTPSSGAAKRSPSPCAQVPNGDRGILIEDDGPGIAEQDRGAAIQSGGRLDTSKPGTGLGLAIANDLLQAYGAMIALEDSAALGGLAVRITLPHQRPAPALKPAG
jgi:signal transduction histidine kinase